MLLPPGGSNACLVAALPILVAGALHAQEPRAAAAQPLALINATVIDGTGAAPRPGQTLLISDGVIRDVLESSGRGLPPGSQVLDLAGAYVLPGLVNTHVHFTPLLLQGRPVVEAELRRMLYGGVTTVRDAAGNARLLAELQRQLAEGRVTGPELHFAALMASPDFIRLDPRVGGRAAAGIPAGDPALPQAVTRATNPRDAASRAAASGARGLKFYVGVEADMLRAITDEGHRLGLRSWAHSTVFPDRPLDVVRGGADVVSHVCWMAWQDADLDPAVNIPYTHTPVEAPIPPFDAALVQVDSPEMTGLFAEMARRGTILDATASLQAMRPGPPAARSGCTEPLAVALTRAAHRAGVALSTGTDYLAPPDDPWPSVLREIEYLVAREVLTPSEAITAATWHGARVLGLEGTHGSIAPGKVANLVVLAADPTVDIQALRRVTMVIQRGRVYPREAYEATRR